MTARWSAFTTWYGYSNRSTDKTNKRGGEPLFHFQLNTNLAVKGQPRDVYEKFQKLYRCDECQTEWEDTWSCACNDRCPTCDSEITPFKSEINRTDKTIMRTALHYMLKSKGLNDNEVVVDRDVLINYLMEWMESMAEPIESLFNADEEDGLKAIPLWWTTDEQ